MIVVVLSVTPEKLRGELTRWLLEISAGVYVGHVSARVRELLWLRIVEDVSRGRALMVWSTTTEQRLDFRVHNHAWETADHDGVTLMRRQTAESRKFAAELDDSARRSNRERSRSGGISSESDHLTTPTTDNRPPSSGVRRGWSNASRRRRYGTSIEQRRRNSRGEPDPGADPSK
ncbi:type I-E CRISPR-associated endoribonuclease Cas2e [Oerskovia flava]|uniref:type I-E CRISPR-associated endoribonuclease Cas2e n=1 Tax=Oerskovia flava TaxID=2986422 RepID=UPI00223EE88D|nr:type I-E CRISPR-associated endoribonuclease Cas2e [Oerskovia sp. JB1-3-2]